MWRNSFHCHSLTIAPYFHIVLKNDTKKDWLGEKELLSDRSEVWILSDAKASIFITNVWSLNSSLDCLDSPGPLTYSLQVKSLKPRSEQMIYEVLENAVELLEHILSQCVIFLR